MRDLWFRLQPLSVCLLIVGAIAMFVTDWPFVWFVPWYCLAALHVTLNAVTLALDISRGKEQ